MTNLNPAAPSTFGVHRMGGVNLTPPSEADKEGVLGVEWLPWKHFDPTPAVLLLLKDEHGQVISYRILEDTDDGRKASFDLPPGFEGSLSLIPLSPMEPHMKAAFLVSKPHGFFSFKWCPIPKWENSIMYDETLIRFVWHDGNTMKFEEPKAS